MAETTQVLGQLPVNRGTYSPTEVYYKDNVVQFNNCSWYCKNTSESGITGVEPSESSDWGLWSGIEVVQELGDAEDKVVSQNKITELISGRILYTDNETANRVIKKLFIDTSNYNGTFALTGLKLTHIANNINGSFGFVLRNDEDEVLWSNWVNSLEESIFYSRTVAGIFIYAELDLSEIPEGTSTYANNLTKYAFMFDPRSKNELEGNIQSSQIVGDIPSSQIVGDIPSSQIVGDIPSSQISGNIDTSKLEGKIPSSMIQNVENFLTLDTIITGNNIFAIEDATIILNSQLYEGSVSEIEDDTAPLGKYYTLDDTVLTDKNVQFRYPVDILSKTLTVGMWIKSNLKLTIYIALANLRYVCRLTPGSDYVEGTLDNTTAKVTRNPEVNFGEWKFISCKIIVETDVPYGIIFTGNSNTGADTIVEFSNTLAVENYGILNPYNEYVITKLTVNDIEDLSLNNIEGTLSENQLDTNLANLISPWSDLIYGTAGDSLTHGSHLGDLISDTDPYAPIDGPKYKSYGYYIASKLNCKWANYGLSGSTLGDVTAMGSYKNGFSAENGRYTKIREDLTHLSIWFGWNDSYYGPIMKREEWLEQKYGTKLYWAADKANIGTVASDGTPYVNQEQYDTCYNLEDTFNGVSYTQSGDYFDAVYIGTVDDETNKTFLGAYNIVIRYFISNYPNLKLLLISPFGTSARMRQAVRDVAKVYGLPVYDFSSSETPLIHDKGDQKCTGMIGDITIEEYRTNTFTKDGLHPNDAGYQYLYPSIMSKLLSL